MRWNETKRAIWTLANVPHYRLRFVRSRHCHVIQPCAMPILRFLRLLRVLSPFHTGKFLSKVAVESQLSQETFSVNSPLTKVYNLRKSLSQHRTCSLFCSKETFYWESGLIKCATCYHKYRGGGLRSFGSVTLLSLLSCIVFCRGAISFCKFFLQNLFYSIFHAWTALEDAAES